MLMLLLLSYSSMSCCCRPAAWAAAAIWTTTTHAICRSMTYCYRPIAWVVTHYATTCSNMRSSIMHKTNVIIIDSLFLIMHKHLDLKMHDLALCWPTSSSSHSQWSWYKWSNLSKSGIMSCRAFYYKGKWIWN